MGKRANAGTCLRSLVKMALPLCQQAERECPRTGPGRKPEIPDWVVAVLIMVGVAKRRKSKSAQFRFLYENRKELLDWMNTNHFPSRSTFFDRYRRAHQLFETAIRLQGQKAIDQGIVDARQVSVDKSMVAARGPLWHKSDRNRNRIPEKLRGVDQQSDWGCSHHDGWVQGYSYEVVVSSTKSRVVFPLLASGSTASAKETKTVEPKLSQLPDSTRFVSADSGYDSNAVGEKVEWTENQRRTGRHFLCAENKRGKKSQREPDTIEPRNESHKRRLQRQKFYASQRGRSVYRQRSKTVEPFNEWFKGLFELDQRVWHRGLENNQTQMLAAIFVYQLLVRFNFRKGNKNARIKWILDIL